MALEELYGTCTMNELHDLWDPIADLQKDVERSVAKCLIANSAHIQTDEKLIELGFELVFEYMGGHGSMIHVWMKDLNK
jgi:hypothetical protein